ncbi:DoxX family protein [Candidatus Woesearchaeota archaeon]|nr:DoxX family protein [Candidatus Woesearchaeota archaeon]
MAKNELTQWTLTLLRVVLGVIFAYHGYLKLFVKGGLPGTASFFAQVGIPLANLSAVVVAFAEFFGGILLLLGLLTKWTSLVLIFQMLVAFFMVHLRNGFLVSKGGYEFVLLILAALVALLVNGAGSFSLGKKLFKSKQMH